VFRIPFSSSNRLLFFLFASLAFHGALFLLVRNVPDRNLPSPIKQTRTRITVGLVSPSAPVQTQPVLPEIQVSQAPPVQETVEQTPEVQELRQDTTPEAAAKEPGKPDDQPAENAVSATSQPDTPAPVAAAHRSPRSAQPIRRPVPQSGPSRVSFTELSRGLDLPLPHYPEVARRWGYEGVVTIEIHISADGRVTEATLLGSSGYSILDNACIKTIEKKWRFPAPGREITTIKEFAFKLRR
jgi:protein TonB